MSADDRGAAEAAPQPNYLAGVPHLPDVAPAAKRQRVSPAEELQLRMPLERIKLAIRQRRAAWEKEHDTLVEIEPPFGYIETRRA